ncbi:MAG TPA: GNAT family N-acetyltransferase [Paludibacter sp.]|nr:GNAT family N-acetyltransferase [Paludibacter sp.]
MESFPAEKLIVRQLVYDSEEYTLELELRDEVLRKPLGRSIYDDNLKTECGDCHIGAFLDGKLVGVMILTSLNPDEVKMRQVVVNEAYRNQNVGTEMVGFAEKIAKEKGYKSIVLDARRTAAGFYEKLQYEKVSGMFLEINIPHYKMRKII